MTAPDMTAKLRRFETALSLFVERLQEDPQILAAVLVGSVSSETIWWKNSLHVWLIEADGVTKRLKADGGDEDIFRILAEEGVNIHAQLIPRSRFKRMVEGVDRTAFSCNFFDRRELLFARDPSIATWFQEADTAARTDQQREALAVASWTIHSRRHAERLLAIRNDLQRCKQSVIWTAHAVAAMEVVRHGEVHEGEMIYRGIELRPDLFQTIYLDVITKRLSKKLLRTALEAVDDYLDSHWEQDLQPVLHYLGKQERDVPLTEISDHFAATQLHPWHLESACEWLHDKGRVEKLSAPFKLTKKSRVDVEEPAYMLLTS